MSQTRFGKPSIKITSNRQRLTDSERQIYNVIKYKARTKDDILDLRRYSTVLKDISPGTIDRGLRKLVEKGWARKTQYKREAPKWEGVL